MAATPQHGRQQPQQRPDGAHQPLGQRVAQKYLEQEEQSGEAGIDQPRPMGFIADRRLDPGLAQIEPALAGEEIAYLDEPHRVVGVEQGFRRAGPIDRDQLEADGEPGEQQQDGEARLTQGRGHRSARRIRRNAPQACPPTR